MVQYGVVEIRGVREPAIEGEIAGNIVPNGPVHQLPEQLVVVDELPAVGLALIPLGEAVKLHAKKNGIRIAGRLDGADGFIEHIRQRIEQPLLPVADQ